MEFTKEQKIALTKGTVDIKVNNTKKEVYITIGGQYRDETLEEFFKQYIKHTSNLNKAQYDIVIDCHLLGVFQPHLLDGVAEAYKQYRDFKSVKFINPKNKIGKMQLTRVAKQGGHMDFFEFVDR